MIRATLFALSLFAATAQSQEMPRTISVDGTGFVAVVPDMARVNVAIEERDPSLTAAQTAVADATDRVLELLEDLDIEERHVNSTGATVAPDYRWNRQSEEQELVGYIVRRQIEIEVRDLDRLGELVDGAVRAGVNQVSPPALDISTRRDAYRQALAKASEDARQNAEALAESMGVEAGEVVSVSAASHMPIPIRMPSARAGVATLAMAEAGVAQETFTPGEMRIEARVVAVFAIED